MRKERKAVAIIVDNDYVLVEKVEDKYAFPSVASKSVKNSKNLIKKLFEKDISDHKDFVSVDNWRTFEYIDYSNDVLIKLDCIIIDFSASYHNPEGLTKIKKNEIVPTSFIYEHKTISEFYSAVPDRNNLLCNDLYGQVFLEDERICVSFTNEKLMQMEIEHVINDEYFPLYFYEFISTNVIKTRDTFTRNTIEQNGSFFQIRVLDINENEEEWNIQLSELENDETIFAIVEGDIYFSASPVLLKRGKAIVISNDKDKKIDLKYNELLKLWENKVYPKTLKNPIEIKKYLKSKYTGIYPNGIDVRIYNVGQANCCYCDFEKRKALFDIGITYISSQIETVSSIKNAITSEISTLKVDDVILSHWDLDHILGVTYNSSCMNKKTWIAPDPNVLYKANSSNIGISQLRLLNYLHVVGRSKIMLVDTSAKEKELFTSDVLSIYLGSPKKRNLNALNNGGLIAKINNKENLLIPGDCENDFMPSAVTSATYDHVIVSHHGSIMSPPKFKGKKPNNKNKAYISIGMKTKISFNEDTGIDSKYNACGFGSVCRTRDLNGSNYSCYRFIL